MTLKSRTSNLQKYALIDHNIWDFETSNLKLTEHLIRRSRTKLSSHGYIKIRITSILYEASLRNFHSENMNYTCTQSSPLAYISLILVEDSPFHPERKTQGGITRSPKRPITPISLSEYPETVSWDSTSSRAATTRLLPDSAPPHQSRGEALLKSNRLMERVQYEWFVSWPWFK